MDELQHALIRALNQALAEDRWLSGSSLAQQFDLSREAISKRIRKLREWGIGCETRSGLGYRLAQPLELLDPARIRAGLARPCELILLDSTASTNDLASAQTTHPCLCLAEHQSAGRGRRGRTWQSPYAQNLYLSLRWQLNHSPERLPSLSLALGITLAQRFQSLGIPARIKWPNDLYLNGLKFGGLLIEQRSEANGPCTLIVGLGVNIGMHDADIDQAWTSLALQQHPISRNDLTIALANALMDELAHLSNQSLESRLQAFDRLDAFAGHQIRLDDGQRQWQGLSRGIDNWGRIQIETDDGLQAFSVGDVSLRALTR